MKAKLECEKMVENEEILLRKRLEQIQEQKEKQRVKQVKAIKVEQPLEHTKGAVPLTPGLFKELPFFKLEPILIVVVIMASVVSLVLEAIGLIQGIALMVSFSLIAFILTMFFAKWIAFLPRGRKLFVEKSLEGGGIQVAIMAPPKDNKIHFSSNDLENPPAAIDRYNKHYEFYTGKPWVKVAQNHSPNYSVSELFEGKMDKTAKENEAILHQTYDTGLLDGIGIALRMKGSLKQPITIIAIATLILMVILIVLGALQFDTLTQIAEHILPVSE